MSSSNQRRRLNVITVYDQTEVVHTNGVRRVVPTFVRRVDRNSFGKTKTVFTQVTKNRFEVKKVAALMPYTPVRSVGGAGSRCLLDSIDMDFKVKAVKEFFTPIRRRMTSKTWYRREDCFKYLLSAGIGWDVSPRTCVSYIDRFNVWLKDHNYFRREALSDSEESGAQLRDRREVIESVGHSALDSLS